MFFEVLSVEGTGVLLLFPDAFGRLLLSNETQTSTACEVRPGEGPSPEASPLPPADGRVASWFLGIRVGQDAQARQSSATAAETLRESAASIGQLADLLKTARPEPFVANHIALANTEFTAFVENDATATAHHLAVNYGSLACHGYKIGAFWGYAMRPRFAFPGQRSIYAVEIRYHAKLGGIPESVWRPMIEATPRDATTDQIRTQTASVTEALTAFLREH